MALSGNTEDIAAMAGDVVWMARRRHESRQEGADAERSHLGPPFPDRGLVRVRSSSCAEALNPAKASNCRGASNASLGARPH